ncbi:MAG: Endoribonuclease MazF9 [Planctomycetes bacterium]|nr:Endoribonuclease MazF9 [Planctomycetota bacterium]
MIRRGDVYFADVGPVRGGEPRGRRPVLVVSSDRLNARDLTITVVAGTDASNIPRAYPTQVLATAQETGLPIDTVFLCFRLRSIDPVRLLDPRFGGAVRAGRLPAARMTEVDAALRLVLGL